MTTSPGPSTAALGAADTRRHPLASRPQLWIPVAYAALAGAWIALSDRYTTLRTATREQMEAWSMIKGFLFVLTTATLLYLVLRRAFRREREAWQRLRHSEEQLRQAQKLESVGRLAGGVAHDFNNLLTVILGGAGSLAAALSSGLPADAEDVQAIDSAARRAADLTRQLLTFARKQVIEPVPVDLGLVVRGSEQLLQRLLGEDVELLVKSAPGLWRTRCDPGQLVQVVLNLAVNARDAMPGGGKLTIELANVEVGAAAHPAGELPAGEYVRMAVRDSGTGMSDEVMARLFEPFFTTKPLGRGTGLGLATSYGIVKQSGGAIRVESAPGRGTLFEVLLPRTHEEAAATPAS